MTKKPAPRKPAKAVKVWCVVDARGNPLPETARRTRQRASLAFYWVDGTENFTLCRFTLVPAHPANGAKP